MRAPLLTIGRWAEIGDVPALGAGVVITLALAAALGSCASFSSGSSRATGVPSSAGASAPVQGAPSPPLSPAILRVQRLDQEPVIRVRIGAALAQARLAGPARVMLEPLDRPGDVRIVQTPIVVTREPGQWHIVDGAGQSLAIRPREGAAPRAEANDDPLRVRALGGQALTLGAGAFPGELVLHHARTTAAPPASVDPASIGLPGAGLVPATTGTPALASGPTPGAIPDLAPAPPVTTPLVFDVIEHVALEAYLPGVIAKELVPGWSPATFEAQAIAARTYAMHERQRSIALGERFDLESSQLDQVYAGDTSADRPHAAVRATSGLVLTFEGRLLRAYYSSTCGGRSNSARFVWPTTNGFEFNLDGPIQGRGVCPHCTASPLYRWTVTRPRDELVRRISAYGRDNGFGVRSLASLERLDVKASNPFGRPVAYRLVEKGGRWHTLSAEELRAACNWTGSSGLPGVTRQTRVNSGDLTLTLKDGAVVLAGRGFGHGVGLCQFGAQGMAKQGAAAADILGFSYPGATLTRVYGKGPVPVLTEPRSAPPTAPATTGAGRGAGTPPAP